MVSDWTTMMNHWKEGSVHCLQNKYVLSLSTAGKYGYTGGFDKTKVQPYGTGWAQEYYATSIKTYKFNSAYAKFDLGQTGGTYYPSFYEPGNTNPSPVLIDFAHEDFFFTQDSKKKLSDLQQ